MRILPSLLLVLLFVPSWSGDSRLPLYRDDATMHATPLAIAPGARIGRLSFLAGWELDSGDPAFGGFSAMAVNGRTFTLLSDGGNFVRFTMDGHGAISNARFGALPDGPGTGWRKADRDSESLAIDPATGQAWVGFERSGPRIPNAIWRYSDDFARAEGHAAPAAMRRWPVNGGAEALVRLRSGDFVAFSERSRLKKRRFYRAVWFAGDPTRPPQRHFGFAYRPPRPGFHATDAAELPDGDLLVLNRAISLRRGFRAELAIVPRAAIRPGARVRGHGIARLGSPLPADNYEAIAVTREGGETMLWIVSDDNQSWFQRTLLLKFRLEEARPDADARR